MGLPIRTLTFLWRRALVHGQSQQTLRPYQAFLFVEGESAPSAALRLSFRDFEGDRVSVHLLAVLGLCLLVADHRLRIAWAKQIGTIFGSMKIGRQRLTHVRHHRSVEQCDRIELVREPSGVDRIVLLDCLGQLSALCFFVGVMLCVGLRDGDLGLLLEPEALLPALDPPFVGNRDTFQRPTDGAAENEDQPPKVSEELERFVHTPMMPPLDRYHRWTDTTVGPIPPAGITLSRNGKKAGRE